MNIETEQHEVLGYHVACMLGFHQHHSFSHILAKSYWHTTIPTLMQPLQYDTRLSVAKHHSIASATADKKSTEHLSYSERARVVSKQISALKQRCPQTSCKQTYPFCTGMSVDPKKTQCFVQILTFEPHQLHVAVPTRSSNSEVQNTKEAQHSTQEQVALMQRFHYSNCFNSCNIAKHNVNKETQKSRGDLISTAWAIRARIYAKAAMPASVAQANLLFSAPEQCLLTPKTQ